MAYFMDVHTHMKGLTKDQLRAAHDQDLANEKGTGVHFIRAWGDPKSGHVFCLSEGPSLDAVKKVHQESGHPADEIYEVPVIIE
jgi:hypothetical protein